MVGTGEEEGDFGGVEEVWWGSWSGGEVMVVV